MAATNKNGSGIYTEEETEMQKYSKTWDNMQKTNNMTSDGIASVNNQISNYEKQYGGNLFDVDENTFTDEATRNQFLTDRNSYGYLTSLRDTYNAQVENAKKAQAEKEAYANTRRTLMDRYIPETLQAMGLANTGLTADALLRAENNYNNYILGAKSESQQAQSDAMQSYRDAWQNYTLQRDAEALDKFRTDNINLDAIKTGLYNGEYDADFALQRAQSLGMGDYYQKEISNYATKLEQEALARTYREQMTANPSAELVADIEEAKAEGSITQEVYDELMDTYKEATTTEAVKAGNQPIKAPNDGIEYKLVKKTDANLFATNQLFKAQLKELGFSDPYDTKIPNGTTIIIVLKNRTGMGAWIPEDKTVTYYNGEWYLSEAK